MALEDNNLIALNTSGFVDGHRVESFAAEVDFCPSDKKCRCMMNVVEAHKIEIAAIHDIYGPRLDDQFVEYIDAVDLTFGYDDHRGNVAAQIQQGMEFYGALPLAPPFALMQETGTSGDKISNR